MSLKYTYDKNCTHNNHEYQACREYWKFHDMLAILRNITNILCHEYSEICTMGTMTTIIDTDIKYAKNYYYECHAYPGMYHDCMCTMKTMSDIPWVPRNDMRGMHVYRGRLEYNLLSEVVIITVHGTLEAK